MLSTRGKGSLVGVFSCCNATRQSQPVKLYVPAIPVCKRLLCNTGAKTKSSFLSRRRFAEWLAVSLYNFADAEDKGFNINRSAHKGNGLETLPMKRVEAASNQTVNKACSENAAEP